MIELTKYFPPSELDLAWIMCKELSYIHGKDGDLSLLASGMAQKIAECQLPAMDRKIVLSSMKILGEFMRNGPVIIRPGLNLSRALLDTKLNFSSTDYCQPFKSMAVEIPNEILGDHAPAIAFVYQPFPAEIVVWMRDSTTHTTYNCTIGPDLPTIEDRIGQKEWADTADEGKFFHEVCRIAVNACLLAATRQTKVDPLPDKIVRKRARRNDPRVQQLAGRCCQEIVFRDLIVYDRVKHSIGDGGDTGVVYGPQHRRGHWKKVLYGPKFSLHRLQWINDYWTHRDIKFGVEQPTIVMK